ncbi:MAG: hypothetical protein HY066_04925 [Betaproteobacteria bacterium]|nr:hypothetical protein [Betaproteobacteria bacterium]
MSNDAKEIKNPEYFWAMRIAFWIAVLVNLPLFFAYTYKIGTALGNTLTLLFYCYLAVASYIMSYRLNTPPKWSSLVVPAKWITEWRHLVYADPESIKSNRNGLLRVISGAALLTILLLAALSGKL